LERKIQTMQKKYRTNGAIGAILDEYERAIEELISVLKTVSTSELVAIVDRETKDEDCRSIQTILTHVVRSGYGYAIYVRQHEGEKIGFMEGKSLKSIEEYTEALLQMFAYNAQLFEDYPNLVFEELDNDKKILTRWGQLFDVEQLFEHAIVHILRHRRQIERFLLVLKK
jgi:uncharacterized damage-inducible protein DinB